MDLRSLIAKMDAIESKISEAPETAAPAAAPTAAPVNPWTNDPAKAAAWDKLSPQIKANIGGADPTDNIIVRAMADGSGWGRAKGINDANPDGTPKVAPQAANPAPAAPAAPAATSQAVNPDSEQGQMLAKQTQGMNDPQSGVAGVQGGSEQDRKLAAQTAGMDAPEPAAAPAAAPAAPQKNLLPVDPNIKAFQDEVLKTDPKAFARFGADGRKGTEVNNAITKYPQIAAKYKLAPAAPGTKPAPNQAANPAAGAKEIPPELLQKFPSPKQGQEVWHKGTRYKYTLTGGGRGGPATGRWAPTFQKGDWGWNQNQANARSGYSDPAFAAPQAANPVKEGMIAKALIESFGYTK